MHGCHHTYVWPVAQAFLMPDFSSSVISYNPFLNSVKSKIKQNISETKANIRRIESGIPRLKPELHPVALKGGGKPGILWGPRS